MKVAIIGEGETEFYCAPKLVGRLGHVLIHRSQIGGGMEDWEATIKIKVLPQAQTAALKKPDKLVILLDREGRDDCCPTLAGAAITIIAAGLAAENLKCPFCIIVSDRKFECLIMADFGLLDGMPILNSPVSNQFDGTLDGKNPLTIVKRHLRPGSQYHKIRDGGKLASKMKLGEETAGRSRALKKLIKELTVPE